MGHRLIDYTDTEIANALHFVDAHVEDLTDQELYAWQTLTEMLFNKMDVQRELDAQDAEEAEIGMDGEAVSYDDLTGGSSN